MGDHLENLEGRVTEEYLLQHREFYGEHFNSWKSRIAETDRVLRGEFPVLYPGEQATVLLPVVQNLAETFTRDVARLVNEAEPTIQSGAKNDTDRETRKALVREAAADTHWMANRGRLMVPLWTMDLLITGAAFAVAWTDSASEYPHFLRVDPRYCYPDIHNGVLQDLLVSQRMKLRVADRLFPDLGLMDKAKTLRDVAEDVEVWDYYSRDESVKAVSLLKKGGKPWGASGVVVVKRWQPMIDCPPVAFVQLPSHDGAFRGMLDQIGGSLTAKNRIVQRIIEYMDQLIHAPFFEVGVTNWQTPPGPRTVYHGDPNSPVAPQMTRLSPAGSAPDIYALVSYLDEQQRGQIAYPASRQGNVSQSIASAAFVSSTQGNLSSVVREVQYLLGDLRRQLHHIGFALDQKWLDFEKPLVRSVEKQSTYVPSRDIDGRYDVEVIYGVGAGLDRLNADVRLLQFKGAGILSDETVRANIEFLKDPAAEPDRIEREEVARAIRQRFLTDPSIQFDFIAEVLAEQRKNGLSLVDAVAVVRQRMQAQAPAAPAEEELPTPPAGEPAATEQLALERGAVPEEQVALEHVFQPPPLEQILIRP